MLTSAISATNHQASASAHSLVKTSSGEYTAASVESNPALGAGLIKLKDGNYAIPIVPMADRFPGLQAALPSLKLGGWATAEQGGGADQPSAGAMALMSTGSGAI